ncbi:MAG: 50S ribosomal protein L23 [Thermoanaerobaculum sp.]|nr:50S ribosomal protein L23 [Thermoanaerobaculum sp.]MCX7896205.1 50S ribosomal protein L23 [Thermoanaerobaculum sp.]MDW7966758.1 50S ribosomal protein L23 [Thermoanaerobaculum sp.]
MKDPRSIILRPLITEKVSALQEQANILCFQVAPEANKVEIRRAVEKLFGVKVQSVQVANMRGKLRRYGRFAGYRPDWRKAYVRLAPGEKTPEFFEKV